jgi:hypothetical protein
VGLRTRATGRARTHSQQPSLRGAKIAKDSLSLSLSLSFTRADMYAAGDAQEFLRGHVDKLDLQIKRARDKLANDQSGRLTLSKETQAQAQKKNLKSTQYSDFYMASVPGHPQQVDPGSGTRKKSQKYSI